MTLAEQKCVPCRKGDRPLSMDESRDLARDVPGWSLSEQRIERDFKFEDFRAAMAFVNRVAEAANEQDHHPDLQITYSRVRILLSTHAVGGLSRNDFILAAKIDQLVERAGDGR
jgi:4a-hydroxytetrahydrobiopterin dehydratase